MQEDDIVETSDAEEHEVLELGGSFPWADGRRMQRHDARYMTPRKRRKYEENSGTHRSPVPMISSPRTVATSAITSRTSTPGATPSLISSKQGTSPKAGTGTGINILQTSLGLPTHSEMQRCSLSNSQDDELDLFSTKLYGPDEILPERTRIESSNHSEHGTRGADPPDRFVVGSRVIQVQEVKGSSLPPSSPPRSISSPTFPQPTSNSAPTTAGSEAILQSMQEISIRRNSGPNDTDSSFAEESAGNGNEAPMKRYSLRSREARQLNPYSIEKQFYKEQMKNNPDALVKVVSPRQLEKEMERRNRAHRDDDYITPDEESQGSPRRRRNRGIENEEVVKHWLPEAFNMSDEDVLMPLAPVTPQAKRPSEHGKRRLPMHRQKGLPRAPYGARDAQSTKNISYKRRKDSLHANDAPPFSPTTSASRSANVDIRQVASVPDRFVETDDEYEGHGADDPSTLHIDPGGESPANLTSDQNDNESEQSDEDELSIVDKRQLKALRHVMPKFMIKKMLKNQGDNSKSNSRASHTHHTVDPDSGSESSSSDGDAVLAGKAKIKKRLGRSSTPQIVKGDYESSDSERSQSNRRSPALIEVVSDTSIDSSDDSSMDGPRKYPCNSAPRYEISLIDRMLSRTRTGGGSRAEGKNRMRERGSEHRRPRNDPLNLQVGFNRAPQRPFVSHRHDCRQTKLPLREPTSSRNLSSAGIEQTRSEDHNHVIDVEVLPEPNRKRSKKERREAVQRSGLHTFAGSGRSIGTGKRKGFLQVQIDMADRDLRSALKPIDSLTAHSPECPSAVSRTHFTRTHSTRRPEDSLNPRNENLKQSSLHNFAYPADGIEMGLDPAGHTLSSAVVRSMDRVEEISLAECSADFDISVPTPGMMFSTSTYLGRQALSNLLEFVDGTHAMTPPSTYSGFNSVELDPYMTSEKYCATLEVVFNLTIEWLEEDNRASLEAVDTSRYEHMLEAVCLQASWLSLNADETSTVRIGTAILDLALRLIGKLEQRLHRPYRTHRRDDTRPHIVLWFVVELTTRNYTQLTRRGSQCDHVPWKQAVLLTIRFLLLAGMDSPIEAIKSLDLSSNSIGTHLACVWIGLIHLLPRVQILPADVASLNGPFWSLLLEIVKTDRVLFSTDVELSEQLWKLLFSLSALSRFSPRGVCTSDTHLPISWDVVSFVLGAIRLSEDPQRDARLSRASLRKRDKYVRIVVARCFLLTSRWKWPLRSAHSMVKRLIDIFKSRSFGNLIGERPDFPAFLRHYDLTLLSKLEHSDTAFNLFLKLVVHAIRNNSGTVVLEQHEKARITKLLSLSIPLSKVSFTRTTPPVGEELSLLINRYSAIITAIFVEPTVDNVRSRLSRARSYIDFLDADDGSRAVCIRAVMYSAVLINHLSLPLDEPLNWLAEIGDALLTEYRTIGKVILTKALHERHSQEASLRRVRTTIQLLLGCMRNIVERPQFEDAQLPSGRVVYPDIALIRGPWIRVILSSKDMTSDAEIRHQILLLVRAFLDARVGVIGVPKRPVLALPEDDNSESQELYGDFAIDEELLEALDQSEGLVASDKQAEKRKLKEKDMEVAEAMNSEIIQNIFRLLLQVLHESRESRPEDATLERFWFNADEWVDCWVGCAAIVVYNGLRDWDHYMEVGPQSWGGISDSFFRRRVALRFMYKLLLCDPTAYKRERTTFLKVFLEALISFKLTIEHDYVSLVLSIDGLKHSLLSGLTVASDARNGDIQLSKQQFLLLRPKIISTILHNLNCILDVAGDGRTLYKRSILVECIVAMLSAMQDVWKHLTDTSDREKYGEICRIVFSGVNRQSRVASLQRLVPYLAWGNSIFKAS